MIRNRYFWVAFIMLFAGIAWFVHAHQKAESAEAIVERCSSEADHASCYEKEVPVLFSIFSISKIFSMVREIRRLDPSYQFCHVLAHKLGETAVASDPSTWLDLIPMNPKDGMCSNGFIHGVIVGRFRNDTLNISTLENSIPEFARACEPRDGWQPSGLDQGICYHGMGHLFMFITNADIRRSLDVCARVAQSPTGDFMRVCREGVFMQIYQPLEPDDFALIDLLPEKPTRENYRRLCSAYKKDEEEGACLREAWPFFREEILKGSGVQAFCSGQPSPVEESRCYESALTIIGRQLLGDDKKTSTACDAAPHDNRSLCYTVISQAILEEDRTQGARAIASCERARGEAARECLTTLTSRARWLFGADVSERDRFCALLSLESRAPCSR